VLPQALQALAGGVREIEVSAGSVRELIATLEAQMPGVAELVAGQMAVAIDGEIFSDPLLEPIDDDSEVHFLPRISGG
jgi:molybdopterin converting factor small subunit